MSRLNLAAAAAVASLSVLPSTALAGTPSERASFTRAAPGEGLVQRIAPRTPAPGASGSGDSDAVAPRAKRSVKVQIGATTGVIYLSRTETRQVGQGGAWVVAGAVGAALAPATAGVGTIAAIGVGVALGSVGSKLIDQQLAAGQCLKVSTPWISLGTSVKIGWAACTH